jgi:opacity protein-like surface antigen
MKKHLLRVSLAAIATAFAVQGALAQGSSMGGLGSNRMVSFGVGGGVSVPVSDAKDAFKNGFVGQGFIRINSRMLPISPRLDFTFSQFDLAHAQKSGTSTTVPSGTSQLLAGLVNLQYALLKSGPIRPYIVAGLGAYNIKTDTDAAGAVAATSSSDTRFGLNGGAGVLIKLGSIVSGFVEGRVDNVYTQKGPITKDQVQMVPVTFGLVF